MAKQALLLLVLAILVLSGCVTGPAPTGQGITILSFEAIPSEVYSGENVQLALKIQNQGASTAKDVKVKLFGIDPTEWQAGTRFDREIGDMVGAIEGMPGATETIYWTVQTPSPGPGITYPYTVTARVFYKYTTSAVQTITVVSEKEFMDLKDRGQTLPIKSTVYTQGPLTIAMTTKPVYASETWEKKWFPISFRIQNVGGGVLRAEPGWGWTPTYGGVELEYPVKVTIEMPSGLSLRGDCADYEWGKWVSLFDNSFEDTCLVDLTSIPEISVDKTIRIKLDYDYYISASTTITVTGRTAGGLFG